jgi:hypothetical protein
MERSQFGSARSVFGSTVKSKTSLKRPENKTLSKGINGSNGTSPTPTPSWRNRQSGSSATSGASTNRTGQSNPPLRYGSISNGVHKSPARATRKLNIRAAPKPPEADDELAKLEAAAVQAQAEVDRRQEEKKARRAVKQKEGATNGRSWAAKKRQEAELELKRLQGANNKGVTPSTPPKPRNGVRKTTSSPPKRTYASPKRSVPAASVLSSPVRSGSPDSPIAYKSPARHRSPQQKGRRVMATSPVRTSPVRTSPSKINKSPVVVRPSSPPGKISNRRLPTKTKAVPKRTFTRKEIRTAVNLQAWWRGSYQRRKFLLELHKYAKKIVKLQTKLEALRMSKKNELEEIERTVKEYKEETKAKLKKKKESMANKGQEAADAEKSATEQKKENSQIRAKNELLKKNSRNLRINNLRLEKSSESSGDYYVQLKAHHDRCVEDNKKLEKVETNYKAKVEEMEANLSTRTKYANTEHKICALYRSTIREATTLGEDSNDENLILTLYQIAEEIEHLEKDWKDEDIVSPVKTKSTLKGKKSGDDDDDDGWLAKPTLRGKSSVGQPPLARGDKKLTKAVSKKKVKQEGGSDSPAESPPKATKAKVCAVQSKYKSKAAIDSDSDSGSDDAKPVTKTKVVTSSLKPTTRRPAKPDSDSDSDSDSDDAKPITKSRATTSSSKPMTKRAATLDSDSGSVSDDIKPTQRVHVKKKPPASTADSDSDSSSSDGDVRNYSSQQTSNKSMATQRRDVPESDSDSDSSESEVSALTEPTGRVQSRRRSSLDSSDSDSSDSS